MSASLFSLMLQDLFNNLYFIKHGLDTSAFIYIYSKIKRNYHIIT